MTSQSMNVSCTRGLPVCRNMPVLRPCKGFQYTGTEQFSARRFIDILASVPAAFSSFYAVAREPVHRAGQQRSHNHNSKLVPVEKRKAEKRRRGTRIDPWIYQQQQWKQQQPVPVAPLAGGRFLLSHGAIIGPSKRNAEKFAVACRQRIEDRDKVRAMSHPHIGPACHV